MEVNFSINFDLGKNKENKKNNSCCACSSENTLEKWLDTAQKIIRTVKVK